MPQLSDKSKYVKANVNVKEGDIVMFVNGGEEKPDQRGNPKLNITVRLPNGDEKDMSINGTSERNMRKEYGNNSDLWIGKEARVWIKEETVGDSFKDVIYLTHPAKNLKGEVVFQ